MWLRIAAVASWGLAGCRFDADLAGDEFACSAEAVCPDDLVCSAGRCLDPARVPDAAVAIDAAASSAYAASVLADGPILYLRLDDQDDHRVPHYALVYQEERKSLTWYADGAVDTAYDAISFDADADTGDLYLARGDSFGAEALDEVALYDRALGEDRIAAHLAAAR